MLESKKKKKKSKLKRRNSGFCQLGKHQETEGFESVIPVGEIESFCFSLVEAC